jgi:ubiquinone/menaquinone biosynthesis C-methylase UbiE
MKGFKFDMEKLEKLNDPERLKDIPPEYIWNKINLEKADTIIDIGAGTGFFSLQFAQMPGIKKVYALDIADEMIEWMKNNITTKNQEIIPQKMEESSIDLPGELADVVIMINVHHEFNDPLDILNESYRLLKDGGKVAIVDWAKKETEHGPPVSKRYSPHQIAEQINNTPLKNPKIYEELPNHYLVTSEK